MMHTRCVLYTHDFEPITVLALTRSVIEYLAKHQRVNLAVMEPLNLSAICDSPPSYSRPRQVTIHGEWMYRNGRPVTMWLWTHDEENALMLKAAFLPGQTSELKDRERSAFAKGFLKALAELGD